MFWRFVENFEPTLKKVYQKLITPPIPNLKGERDIEYSFVVSNCPAGPGEALDFGCGDSWMGLAAARKGFKVTALDFMPISWHYRHPQLNFIQGDIFKLCFPKEYFDLVLNCSSTEHIGLSGRYGITQSRPDGDIEAMKILLDMLKKDKIMILTLPCGRDRVFKPLHRVYGEKRLSIILNGYEILKSEFWIKDKSNKWIMGDRQNVLSKEPSKHCYGLGLFILKKPL